MPKTVPIQDNFAAGEISPRFLAQVNEPAYKNGVEQLINFFPTSQGPLQRRLGTSYYAEVGGNFGRIFGFPITSDLTAYVVITDNNELWLVTNRGIATGGNMVVNGDFRLAGDNWTDISQGSGYVTFAIGSANLVPGTLHPTIDRSAGIAQTITLLDGGVPHDLTVVCIDTGNQANMLVTVGSTPGGADLFSQTMTEAVNDIEIAFDPQGNTTVYLQIVAEQNDTGADRTVSLVGIVDPANNDPIMFTTPWNTEDLVTVQVDMPPGENTMYFVQRNHPPQYLSYDIALGTWEFGPITFVSAPTEWVTNNYPGSITFFQGRMWLGGTPLQPESFWGSVSGDYLNFLVGSNPADALSFVMAHKGVIQWMVGAKNLLIGTEYGEYIVTSDGGIIIPGDIQVDQQSAYGSAYIQATQIGNRVLYISPDRRKVRDMGYKWTDDGWVSRDITYTSEHITDENLLIDMVFSQNPANFLAGITQTGDMIGASYERGNDRVGWFHYKSTGRVIALATVDMHGTSEVAILVNRDINETESRLYIEVFSTSVATDSAVHLIDQEIGPNRGFTVPHLANQTVQVKVDGAVHPDITLDANGTGTLQWTGEDIEIGLPYVATMTTLPLATTLQIGQSTLPMMKRYNKIFVRIYNSTIPQINGKRPPTREPSTPMNERQPNITEDVKVVNLGWDAFGRINIVQDLPLPCNIAGIFGEAAQEMIGRQ